MGGYIDYLKVLVLWRIHKGRMKEIKEFLLDKEGLLLWLEVLVIQLLENME